MAELAGRQELFQSGIISREELERYTRAYEVASEQYQEKSNHASLISNGSREEDVAFAQADLRLAQANEADRGHQHQDNGKGKAKAGTELEVFQRVHFVIPGIINRQDIGANAADM